MLLAAGLGTRMRPLTEHTAKPLLPLGGRTLLDHALARLAAAGVATVVVNAHWQADRVAAHLQRHWPRRRAIVLRREEKLLDTGGGVRAALPDPRRETVLRGQRRRVLAGRADRPALARLAAGFGTTGSMRVLLVHGMFQVHGEVGAGDFAARPAGHARAAASSARWRRTSMPACN